MRLARITMIAMMLSLWAPLAAAQSNAIVEQYRAYSAALERGDVASAAQAAQAAFDASVARDGDGGRTAVLAMNLATVRLLTGEYAQARSAAQHAVTLARAGASGVDPALAGLVYARANLALLADTPQAAVAAGELNAALNATATEQLADEDVYPAGAQLGVWGFAHNDLQLAQSGWNIAGARAAGSPLGQSYGLGRARANEGIAVVMAELNRRRRGRIDEDVAQEAQLLLQEAMHLLQPLSQQESPTLELTIAQQAYAEARVWMSALDAKMEADGRPLRPVTGEAEGDADGLSEIGPVDLSRPRCLMRLVPRPMPEYADHDEVAAVMLFLRVDARGEIVAHQVAARAGSQQFADEIERVIDRWRVQQIDGSVSNCRMESSLLVPVRFRLR